MNISGREVGPGCPVYVIAEVGVNHDGSPGRAVELVDAAADAGADAVKFQLFRADLLMSAASRLAAYQKGAGESDPLSMLRRLELGVDQMRPAVERARRRGVHAIVTVFSESLVAQAETLGWDVYKTASPDVIHAPLLSALERTGRPIILSTGAATLDEVLRAVGWLSGACARLGVLQCVSSYPVADESAALGGIVGLRGALPGLPIGYSDHTTRADTGGKAVTLGACILEKHLTYDRRAKGPDHAASLDPDGFREYITLARRGVAVAEDDPMAGPPLKRVLDCERDVRAVSRQSVCSTRALVEGTVLSAADLTVKRPGWGIEPFHLGTLIGRRVLRGVGADTPLSWEDLG